MKPVKEPKKKSDYLGTKPNPPRDKKINLNMSLFYSCLLN
jgi:hypothetical protein